MELRSVSQEWADDILHANIGNVRDFFIPFDEKGSVLAWIKECRESMEKGDKIETVIIQRGSFVGMAAINAMHTEPECGLWISPKMQGKGLGKKALGLLLDWVFRHTSITSVRYAAETTNLPSIRLAESLGCKKIKTFIDDGAEFVDFSCEKTASS